MFSELKCEDVKPLKIIRLGKKPLTDNDKPRPIKLVLENEDQKKKLLKVSKNLKQLKEGGWDKVFVHQDLTPRQRKQRQAIVAQLKERIKAGEANLIIVGNKIVTKTHDGAQQKSE